MRSDRPPRSIARPRKRGARVAVRTRADLELVERGERIGLMLALEGVEPFGYELWPADLFWELGLRVASLTWNRRNPYADGAAESGGLSRLGRELLDPARRARRRARSRARLAKRSSTSASSGTRGGSASRMPAAAPSTTIRGTSTDAQLRALAERDGVLGIMLHPLTVDPERRTIDRAIDHIEHAVDDDRPRARLPRGRLDEAAAGAVALRAPAGRARAAGARPGLDARGTGRA